MNMLRCVKYWAVVGLLVPVAIFAIHLSGVRVDGSLVLLLWPSSIIMMMATQGVDGPMGALLIFATIPIALNVVLYSMLGALLYAVWEFVGWGTR